jgi:hypothetical protein
LPFLTALCPSERYGPYARRARRRHTPLAERARGRSGQVRRWLPELAIFIAQSFVSRVLPSRVRLMENRALPVTDVRFLKVSKQTQFLDTFFVHVRAFVCLHDLSGVILDQR